MDGGRGIPFHPWSEYRNVGVGKLDPSEVFHLGLVPSGSCGYLKLISLFFLVSSKTAKPSIPSHLLNGTAMASASFLLRKAPLFSLNNNRRRRRRRHLNRFLLPHRPHPISRHPFPSRSPSAAPLPVAPLSAPLPLHHPRPR